MTLAEMKWPAAVTAARCGRLGLAVVGWEPGRSNARVVVVCPHCRGLRRVQAGTVKWWADRGRVAACRGGLPGGCRGGDRRFAGEGKTT